jgi:hypothetical protein
MGSNSTHLSKSPPPPPERDSSSKPLTQLGPAISLEPELTATPTRTPRITSTEFILDYCLHSSTSQTSTSLALKEAEAKQLLKLLINMNMFKEVNDGVYEPCDIEHLYNMSLRVEKLRQTGERLKRAVLDFDAFMGRKDAKWGEGLV